MEKFLSCDWGTSTFRLRLVETQGLVVLAEETTADGIAPMHARWKERREDRFLFYCRYVKEAIHLLEKRINESLAGLPLLISGMAGSTLGLFELPYKQLPFSLQGNDLAVERFAATEDFNHAMMLISGARTEDDVMRGEETQVIGCDGVYSDQRGLFILPGTHSKHVVVEGGHVVSFKTYMTGEFFELLSQKSILSASVEMTRGFDVPAHRNSFQRGLLVGVQENLLHSSFLVRTNDLLQGYSKSENSFFLSGLLIGNELKDVVSSNYRNITIVGNALLTEYYRFAIEQVLPAKEKVVINIQNADAAIIKGQWKIWSEMVEKSQPC